MPTTGWIITAHDEAAATATQKELSEWEPLDVGDIRGVMLPIAIETERPSDEKEILARLKGLPGVVNIELIFASFEDIDTLDEEEQGRLRRRKRRG